MHSYVFITDTDSLILAGIEPEEPTTLDEPMASATRGRVREKAFAPRLAVEYFSNIELTIAMYEYFFCMNV